jgi:uncharacterized protein YdeI (YjbR/CyaY-like superfamily)
MTTTPDPIHATTASEWRSWLADNHRSADEVWLVIHHKGSGTPSLRYAEAIEHALCYGWIDGLHRKHDATSSRLRFSPRRPGSTWSGLNRERATRMIEAGLMTERGRALVDLAKETGTWHLADVVPGDLRAALDANPAARDHFAAFPPSSKRLILEWVVTAKRQATRARRVAETVTLAARDVRAHHPAAR